MREATARKYVHLRDEAPSDPVLAHRYELYCHAHGVLDRRAGANAFMRVYAQARGCRRACEAIELAETLVENGFARLAPEHISAQHGDCADCRRSDCIVSELSASPAQPHLVAG